MSPSTSLKRDAAACRLVLSAWGRFVHRHRKGAIAVSVVLLLLTLGALAEGGTLLSYQPPSGAESTVALDLLQKQVPGFAESSFFLVYTDPSGDARSETFQAAINDSIRSVRDDLRVESVTTPYTPLGTNDALISDDGHSAMVIVALKAQHSTARVQYPSIRAEVGEPSGLRVLAGGDLAINAGFERTLQTDLTRAETLSLPLTLLLLLVVFGTLVAALLPLSVGVLAVVGGVAAVFVAARVMDISVYAINIVTLIGLGVAIDYSLFIVSRFREERARGQDVEAAIARTMATAGRAVAFSGLTVAVGLLGLAFYSGMYFESMGIAGALVVAFAVLYALVFLPALLSILGPRVEKGRVPLVRGGTAAPRSEGTWKRIALAVMRRPVRVLVLATLVVAIAAAPFASIHLASLTEKALPADTEARRGMDLARAEFPGSGQTTFLVVVKFPGDPTTTDRAAALDELRATISGIRGVQAVKPGGFGDTVALLRVSSTVPQESDDARHIVESIREHRTVGDGKLSVTGTTAFDVDTLDRLKADTPAAVAFVVVATYILLLLQTGSIVLPAKAVLMNVLSIGASFGATVWIFQQGHFSGLLAFTPAPIDPALPVLMFCIIFGLSMDYEVLLLSRMHEEFDKHGDNTRAVADGLEKSGSLITSAALIMVVVFASFASAQVTLIKAIGLGLAIAIAVDATLVRALIVPAAMRLMGRWNWWAPAWVRRVVVRTEH